MLDFPDVPVMDQEFIGGYFSWKWDGAKWRRGLATGIPPVVPDPEILSVTPNTVPVSKLTQVLSVTGNNLDATVSLSIDGATVSTVFVSSNEVQCTIDPLADYAIGIHTITATVPGSVTFDTFVPVPVIDSISPTGGSTGVGPGGINVTITGSGFVRKLGDIGPTLIPGSQVDYNSDSYIPTYDSLTETIIVFNAHAPLGSPGQTYPYNIKIDTTMLVGAGIVETSNTVVFTWTGM